MSRLESMIRRLEAQVACLDWAVREIADLPGPVLELGLGNGRTYDHLRERLAGSRLIYVFDRSVGAHPGCVPPAEFLTLGEIRETLPAFARRGIAPAALAHADLGSGNPEATRAMAAWLGPVLPALIAPRGLVLSDQPLSAAELTEIDPPIGPRQWRYFAYRRG